MSNENPSHDKNKWRWELKFRSKILHMISRFMNCSSVTSITKILRAWLVHVSVFHVHVLLYYCMMFKNRTKIRMLGEWLCSCECYISRHKRCWNLFDIIWDVRSVFCLVMIKGRACGYMFLEWYIYKVVVISLLMSESLHMIRRFMNPMNILRITEERLFSCDCTWFISSHVLFKSFLILANAIWQFVLFLSTCNG